MNNNERDWFHCEKTRVSGGERETAELISAVHIIYLLIFYAKVDKNNFPKLFRLTSEEVFSLAKLICPFTDDFKLLEIYLLSNDANQVGALKKSMMKYLDKMTLERDKYTRTEYKNFGIIIIQSVVDERKLIEEIDRIYNKFTTYDFNLVGDINDLKRAIALIVLVFENVEELKKRLNMENVGLNKFWEDFEGVPFILMALYKVIGRGDEKMDEETSDTPQNEYEYTLEIIAIVLPIFKYVLDNKQDKFRSVKHMIKMVKEIEKMDEYLRRFAQKDRKNYDRLMRYLDFIKKLD